VKNRREKRNAKAAAKKAQSDTNAKASAVKPKIASVPIKKTESKLNAASGKAKELKASPSGKEKLPKTFGDAFAAARKTTPAKNFTYRGKEYSTKTKEEAAKGKKPDMTFGNPVSKLAPKSASKKSYKGPVK
jgi:hypothetical protein